jgi:hypothetical protein
MAGKYSPPFFVVVNYHLKIIRIYRHVSYHQ